MDEENEERLIHLIFFIVILVFGFGSTLQALF